MNSPFKRPTYRSTTKSHHHHHYDIENLLSGEADENESGEQNEEASKEQKSGTEWLKELNERLLNESVKQEPNDNNNANGCGLLNTKKSSSPPSMITVNTSNLYLSENEIKKRKTKFVKYLMIYFFFIFIRIFKINIRDK